MNSSVEGRSSILQTKRHGDPLVQSIISNECSQPAMLFGDRRLPISTFRIECTYEVGRPQLVQSVIDGAHRKSVTNCVTVQTAVVARDTNTRPSL